MTRFSGRQTQFYVDIVFGVTFSLGFGYLLLFGMDSRIAALEAGVVIGYVLRVWENMSIYGQILEDEVAEEVEQQVPSEAEEMVADELET